MTRQRCSPGGRQEPKGSKKLASTLYQMPGFTMASALQAIYAEKSLSDGVVPGIDVVEMKRLLDAQAAAISKGDLFRLEEMLVTQAHVLQAIFSSYVARAAASNYFDHLQCFMGIALRAQSQCRQTLSALADLKSQQEVQTSAAKSSPKGTNAGVRRKIECPPEELKTFKRTIGSIAQ